MNSNDAKVEALCAAVLDPHSAFYNNAPLRHDKTASAYCEHGMFYQRDCRECGAAFVRAIFFQKDERT